MVHQSCPSFPGEAEQRFSGGVGCLHYTRSIPLSLKSKNLSDLKKNSINLDYLGE